jgi:hypothetical protein
MYAALDRLTDQRMSVKSPAVLMYLPQDELHELGLLYLHYLLKARGTTVVFLGQSLPLEHLAVLFKQANHFKLVVSVWTTQPAREVIDQYVVDARRFMGTVPLWVTGLAVSDWKSPDNLTVTFPNLAALGQQLSSELALSF